MSRTMNHRAKRVCLTVLLVWASAAFAADDPTDALAQTLLAKAGIHATVCELPRVGDGALAAALARQGIAQVHALAPDAKAAEAARKPAAADGALGSQVVIETGKPNLLPLGDWVADLLVVADATDRNLADISTAEVFRVLSPYRGVAIVGNPAKGAVSKKALDKWAKGLGGNATITKDDSGLWAVVKMPALKGGDDWGHFYHKADGNPVSDDTVISRGAFSLQCLDKPRSSDKWGTIVAAAGRVFWVPGNFDDWMAVGNELVARNMYNGQILWRRPLEIPFGRNDSLLIATADRVYLKNKNNVLVLNPETGGEITRIVATDEQSSVRWLLLDSAVLITLIGDPQGVILPGPPGVNSHNHAANTEIRTFSGRELAGWDAATGKRLWTFAEKRIDPGKLAARDGRLFFYANNNYAACLDLRNGKQLWKTVAPITDPIRPFCIDWMLNTQITGRQQSLASKDVYLIASPSHGQTQAFSTTDGHLLWQWSAGYPWDDKKSWSGRGQGQHQLRSKTWKQLMYPLVLDNILLGRGISLDPLTGKPADRKVRGYDMGGCGHMTATSKGLLMMQGGGVYDIADGQVLALNFMKNQCGGGGGAIANGVMLRTAHSCVCPEWSGFTVTRSSSSRPKHSTARLERGAAAVPAPEKTEKGDWSTYRATPERSASSVALVAEKANIRWMYTPPRSGRRPVGKGGWFSYEPDGNPSQAIAVGDRIWFGTAEGALVCLDRQTGEERWRYWTAGQIVSAPTWYEGRLYAGSCDGWVYCLDAANGGLIWRYRVAPSERRLMVQGYLSSVWPALANVLVHDDTVFVSAGLMSQLDGTVFCALNARTGEPRWEKRYENLFLQDSTPSIMTDGGRNARLDAKIDTSATHGAPEALFHAMYWGPALSVTVSRLKPGGECKVRLYFVEPWEKDKGRRIFDIAVNGAVKLEKFDLIEAAGGQNKAVMREIPATIDPQGKLTIRLTQSDICKNNCVISAIQVLMADKVTAAFQTGGRGVPEAGFLDSLNLSKNMPFLPAANGQMAWYGDRVWFKSSIYGPIVCDPGSGDMKRAVDIAKTIRDMNLRQGYPDHAARSTWGRSRGQDIGILPGGWVVLGGRQIFTPNAGVNQGRNRVMFLNATADQAGKDSKGFPSCLVIAVDDRRSDIPAWDSREAVVYFGGKSRFQLCRGFSAALTADAVTNVFDPKTSRYWNAGVRRASKLSLAPERCRPVLPDDLHKAYGYYISSPILANNAVVYIMGSSVAAVQRSDRKLLWSVEMPVPPLPGGLSLTRAGDVLVPLLDGRIACVGAGEPAIAQAEPAHAQQPGLILQTYDFSSVRPDKPLGSQWVDKKITAIPLAAEIAAMKSASMTILPAFAELNQACAHPTLVRLRGSIEVPETAVYRFHINHKMDGRTRLTVFDASRRFAEYSVTRGKHFHAQPRPLLLEKGRHPIELIGYQLGDALQIGLDWQKGDGPRTPVSAEALWHDESGKP